MARFVKKAVAFVLVLTTIFLFSTAAFAESTSGSFGCDTFDVVSTLAGDNTKITATMSVTPSDRDDLVNVEAKIIISRVYCPEDAIHPRNYFTETDTEIIDMYVFGHTVASVIDDVPANHVVISATATYYLIISGREELAGSLTIYPY